jgi:hypothetical protein
MSDNGQVTEQLTAEQRRAAALKAARSARRSLNFNALPDLLAAAVKLRQAGPGWQRLADTIARLEAEGTAALGKLTERIEAEERRTP